MRRAWSFGIICLFVTAGCRMTNVETEAPVPDELPLPVKKLSPAEEIQQQEPPPGKYSRNRDMEFHIPGDRSIGKKGVVLWYNSGGDNWARGPFFEAKSSKAQFLVPQDGRYEVVFVPMDHDGALAYTPSQETRPDYIVTVDTHAPLVSVEAPNGGEKFRAGQTVLIKWKAMDPHMKPEGIRIEVISRNNQWKEKHTDLPDTGSFPWDIGPDYQGQFKVRVFATDLAGNTGSAISAKFFIIDDAPPKAWVVGPSSWKKSPAEIVYEAEDSGGAGIREVHLWFTRDDGETWEYYGVDEDAKSPILFGELDGKYGFHAVAVDQVGNRGKPPGNGTTRPQHEMVLDSTPPLMKFLSPKAKSAYLYGPEGRAIEVRWALHDNVGLPEKSVKLEYSANGGQAWILIREKVSNESPYLWSPPDRKGNRFMLRAVVDDFAGNRTIVRSPRFAIDLTVPEARVTGPVRSNKSKTEVSYEILNKGYSPLTKVVLHYSSDGGGHWEEWGEDVDLISPISFRKTDGKYLLYVTCRSEAGARAGRFQKKPINGDKPRFSFGIEIDITPPNVDLTNFPASLLYPAGDSIPVRWTEGPPVEQNPVWSWKWGGFPYFPGLSRTGLDLFYSTDEKKTWKPIALGQDPTLGIYTWELPKGLNEKSVYIQLVSQDSFGNEGKEESDIPFEVDGIPPEVTGKFSIDREIRSLPKTVTVRYRADDGQSGLRSVQLWGMLDDGWPKLLNQNASLRGTISADIRVKGTWKFWLVAEDSAGNTTPEWKTRLVSGYERPAPDFERVIGKPVNKELRLLSFSGGGRPYRGGGALLIALKTNIDLDQLRAKFSADSGKTWNEIPSQDLAVVRGGLLWNHMPEKTGGHYRLLVYSHEKEVRSDRDFSIDATPPKAAIVGPRGPLGKSAVVLDYRVTPSLSLIMSRTLWVTRDAGKTWSIYQVYRNRDGEIVFSSRDAGVYGFYLTASSRVGLSGPPPLKGTAPQHSIQMGMKNRVPAYTWKLALTDTPFPILKGGGSEMTTWKGESTDPKATVTLYLYSNGSSRVLKKGLPLSGAHTWGVPKEGASRCKILASIMVAGVPQWSKPSPYFSIDASPPRVLGTEIVED